MRSESTKMSKAEEEYLYQRYLQRQANGGFIPVKTRTFIGEGGKVCETRLPITDKTVYVDRKTVAEREQKAQERKKREDKERAARRQSSGNRNGVMPTTEDIRMAAAMAGSILDTKI